MLKVCSVFYFANTVISFSEEKAISKPRRSKLKISFLCASLFSVRTKLQKCFLVNREIKKLHFFCLVLSQNNPFRRPFRTLLIKNWMNPEFENCLMQDFKIADMGINLLRVIHTVGTL